MGGLLSPDLAGCLPKLGSAGAAGAAGTGLSGRPGQNEGAEEPARGSGKERAAVGTAVKVLHTRGHLMVYTFSIRKVFHTEPRSGILTK